MDPETPPVRTTALDGSICFTLYFDVASLYCYIPCTKHPCYCDLVPYVKPSLSVSLQCFTKFIRLSFIWLSICLHLPDWDAALCILFSFMLFSALVRTVSWAKVQLYGWVAFPQITLWLFRLCIYVRFTFILLCCSFMFLFALYWTCLLLPNNLTSLQA